MATGDLASKLKGYDDEEEEEEDEEDIMAVEGSDGQQYVVLEVIQLADNQGTEQVSKDSSKGTVCVIFSFSKWVKKI